jgi:hypothetical protein
MVSIRYRGNNLITPTDTLESVHPKINDFLVYPKNVEFLFCNDLNFNKIAVNKIKISYENFKNNFSADYSKYNFLIVLDHTSG